MYNRYPLQPVLSISIFLLCAGIWTHSILVIELQSRAWKRISCESCELQIKKSFIPSISEITLQHISQQQIIAKYKVYWVTIKEWPKELLAVTPFWAKITFHAYGGLTRGRPFEICFYRLSHEITLLSFYMNMKISWYFLSNNHKNIFFHPLKKRKN